METDSVTGVPLVAETSPSVARGANAGPAGIAFQRNARFGEEEPTLMAVKVVHVSDISGREADEQELGKLVVHEHPDYAALPVTLEVLEQLVEPGRLDAITAALERIKAK